jgi:hypothetical protein
MLHKLNSFIFYFIWNDTGNRDKTASTLKRFFSQNVLWHKKLITKKVSEKKFIGKSLEKIVREEKFQYKQKHWDVSQVDEYCYCCSKKKNEIFLQKFAAFDCSICECNY